MKKMILILSLFGSIAIAETKVVTVSVCKNYLTTIYFKNLESNLENTHTYFTGPFSFKLFNNKKAVAIRFDNTLGEQALYGAKSFSRFKIYPLNKVSSQETQVLIEGVSSCEKTKPLVLVGLNERIR